MSQPHTARLRAPQEHNTSYFQQLSWPKEAESLTAALEPPGITELCPWDKTPSLPGFHPSQTWGAGFQGIFELDRSRQRATSAIKYGASDQGNEGVGY